MYVTMALEYERKCTLLCMLDQTRKTPLLSQHHDEGTPICIAALENYPYLAYLQKKIWLRHPYPTPPSYRNFWSGEGTLRGSKISASGCTDDTAPASAPSGIGKLIDMRRVESGDGDHLCRTVRAGNGK